MRRIKHIWKYLTSSTYRFYVDLQCSQQALDAHMKVMRDNLRFSTLPPLLTKYMDAKGIEDEHLAAKMYKAEYGIKRY